MMCRMDEFFSQSSPEANPIYSTNNMWLAGQAVRRLGTPALVGVEFQNNYYMFREQIYRVISKALRCT